MLLKKEWGTLLKTNKETRRYLVKEYLKDQRPLMVGAGVFFVILLLLYYLYNLPFQTALYMLLLCNFFLWAWLIWNFKNWRRKHRQIQSLAKNVTAIQEHLPKNHTFIEKDYQNLIKILYDENEKTSSEQFNKYHENMRYFTLWAHQIKTPIAVMGLMAQGEGDISKAELTEEMKRIEQYVQMALLYVQLESENTDFVIKKHNIDSIIKKALRGYATTFIRKKIPLIYESKEVQITTDEKWLLFVVEQLLSNSLKYTLKQTPITLVVTHDQKLLIQDKGTGIPQEDLPRIFEKGYTGYHGREYQKATGIGLYLCKMICDQLGHGIKISSTVGEGTSVEIDFSAKKMTFE